MNVGFHGLMKINQLHFVLDFATVAYFPAILLPFGKPLSDALDEKLRVCVDLQFGYSC